MYLFSIYQEEMERIDASEKLAMVTSFAVGSGSLKKYDSQRIISKLQRVAFGKRRESIPASPAVLADIGIEIERIKKDKE